MLNPTFRFRRHQLAVAAFAGLMAHSAHAIVTYEGDPGTLGDPASWRTAEFLRDWGLRAIGAEYAYARGYSGFGVKVGAVDSGYFDLHPELTPSRYTGVASDGIAGAFNAAYNDRHGTHVTGTIGAARDGNTATTNFHGVAFNANLFVGNTGKTDSALFGAPPANATPLQIIDQAHIANTYRAVNAQGVRILTSSWGSQPAGETYATMAGLNTAWSFLVKPDTWIQGALDAAATGTVVMFSAGNSGYINASARSAMTYIRPDLEKNWLAVSGLSVTGQTFNADGSINVPGTQQYNQCGIAKWACVTAPASGINGSTVTVTNGVPTATYGSLSGTSMAAPHAAGALAVIMERFSYMTNEQALDVMKTTAIQNATSAAPGQMTAVPDSRNGWGTISLRNAMNGPGQFTGRFAVDTQGQSDVWSNNISDSAIRARKLEDQAEAVTWAQTKIDKGWTNGLPAGATEVEAVEYNAGVAREAARASRVYEGSLAKYGAGDIVLSGTNSYTGGTQLYQGGLVARSATAFGSGNVEVHGGLLSGSATITGSLLNAGGTIGPGEGSGADAIGRIAVLGDFAQFAAGTLDFDIDGSLADLLAIGGTAFLGGTLDISFLGGYSGGSALYDLLTFEDMLGSFSSVTVANLGSEYSYQLVYGDHAVSLSITAVPEPGTYALMLAGLGVVGWLSRRRR